MAPTVRNLTDVLEDPTEDLPTVQQIAELFLRTSTTPFTNKTLNDISNFIYANGLHLKVTALENINIGQPVKFTSYNLGQDEIQVNLADNTFGAAIGLAKENVLSGNEFTIVCCGCLKGFDTTAYNDGETLYLGTNGTLTHTEPTTGIAQPLAFVIKSAGDANGALRVDASYPKQDAADVRFNSEGNSVYDRISHLSNKNKLINGGFDIWQRGTSSSSFGFLADRYSVDTGGTVTITQERIVDNVNGNSLKVTATSSNTGYIDCAQRLEKYKSLSNKTFTYGGWIKSNSSNARIRVESALTGTPGVDVWLSEAHSGNGQWEFLSITIDIGDITASTQFIVDFIIYGADNEAVVITSGDYIEARQLQFEEGSVVTPFEQRPIGYELNLCQRYYNYGKALFQGYVATNILCAVQQQYPVEMRIAPTLSLTHFAGTYFDGTGLGAVETSNRILGLREQGTGTGSGYYIVEWTADAEL